MNLSKTSIHLCHAAITGVVVGGLTAVFRILLTAIENWRSHFLRDFEIPSDEHIGIWVTIAAVFVGASAFATARFAPEAAGSGIPHIKAVLKGNRVLGWLRVLTVKFSAGLLSIGAGLSLGKEGPSVQMGACVGAALSKGVDAPVLPERNLISVGAAAGLASIFNAPLAGFTFAIEELRRDLTFITYSSTFIAVLSADLVTRHIFHQEALFQIPQYPVAPLRAFPVCIVLGILCGLLGVLFSRSIYKSKTFFAALKRCPAPLKAAAVGILCALVACIVPYAVGSGDDAVQTLLDSESAMRFGARALVSIFILKFILTVLSFTCGVPGGIFSPMLLMGALLGLLTGHADQFLFGLGDTPIGVYAIVGMVAFFTGVVRTPITAIILVTEMTNTYTQLLMLMLGAISAFLVAEWLREEPIYDKLERISFGKAD